MRGRTEITDDNFFYKLSKELKLQDQRYAKLVKDINKRYRKGEIDENQRNDLLEKATDKAIHRKHGKPIDESLE